MSGGQAIRTDDDDFLIDDEFFADEDEADVHHWRLLVVDDDEAIHTSTRFVLSDFEYRGNSIELLHAYSADEAKDHLRNNDDIAVILLDVVMETDDAGLRLIEFVRNEMDNKDVRIILRTGQPGVAPEWEVITRYDINDYKTKTELTQEKLFTTVTTALRSFEQLFEINNNRRGLEKIMTCAGELMQHRDAEGFISRLGDHLISFLPSNQQALIVARDENDQAIILCGRGDLGNCAGALADQSLPPAVHEMVGKALEEGIPVFDNAHACFHLKTQGKRYLVIYVGLERPLDGTERQLLDVFCANAVIGLDNVDLFQHVRKLAFQDQLTKLGNRSLFLERLRTLINDMDEGDEYLVIDADLDHFDDINDLIGQENGDIVLKDFANHCLGVAASPVVVCRISGDEFGYIFKTGGENAIDLDVASFQKSLYMVSEVEAYAIPLHVTLGITRLNAGNASRATAESIMRNAWLALRRAKDMGRDTFCYYEAEMDEEVQARAELVTDLRKAIDKGELFVHYQPQFCLENDKVSGMEGLMRWRKQDGTVIPPYKFIPEMERSGLIVAAGEWILRECCCQMMRWMEDGWDGVPVSVNVSMHQIFAGDFPETVSQILEETGLPAGMLKLELTESVIMVDVQEAIAIFSQLKQIGVELAIDDFGTGYSSLSYMQQLDVDVLKIDQSFIKHVTERRGDAVIAETIITLAHNFGMKVIAEGVETADHVNILKTLGCDQVQGYYYSKPLEADELIAFVRARADA
ncbi:two-component system response regulator [Aestuariispira insulae]|uniref:Response regulator receiver modulated diguanylate cyclase/phosphodiesterase n=1 Tax=Aestuariispira insulae TaxID=1461337 RepID=A0A3D9HTU5_9PROT|nr:EAL domain-containing protein [Aestuariispira insulae]RED52296.1 response regulator receiver modulated diguanylate cyclase/phosphodiesterase [Aestuariispira insulae]